MAFYKIRELSRKLPGGSMTEPVRGTLDVILKQDSDNSPTCVYNEIVALRLAQRLGVPLAMGVPSVGDGGTYFASLTVGGLSINLPNISAKKMAGVAKRYPSDAAALFVFDVWVLNNDRADNLKANLTPAEVHLVAGIDHEQTLLGTQGDVKESLQALANLDVCCRSLYFTGRFPNYFARNARGFPALITPVAQCRQVEECEEREEREGGVWSASRRRSTRPGRAPVGRVPGGWRTAGRGSLRRSADRRSRSRRGPVG